MRIRSLVMFGVVILALVIAGLVTLRRSGGFSARGEPTAVERVIARAGRSWAIPARAHAATNPVRFSTEVWAEACAHFADHCAACHANDGSGRTALGQNLYPKAPDMRLADTQALTDGDLYWIIANGIRLTGMPAWGNGGDNDLDTWKLVHFVRRLKDLTPQQLDEMAALNPKTPGERAEEQDDARFLSGDDTAPQTDHTHHHQE